MLPGPLVTTSPVQSLYTALDNNVLHRILKQLFGSPDLFILVGVEAS